MNFFIFVQVSEEILAIRLQADTSHVLQWRHQSGAQIPFKATGSLIWLIKT